MEERIKQPDSLELDKNWLLVVALEVDKLIVLMQYSLIMYDGIMLQTPMPLCYANLKEEIELFQKIDLWHFEKIGNIFA